MPQFLLQIDFTCAPERTEELVKSAFREIGRMRSNEVTDAAVGDLRQALMREYETSSRENGFVVDQLLQAYQDGDDARRVGQLESLYRSLSPSIILDAARQYLDTNNYVRVTLFPEKPAK